MKFICSKHGELVGEKTCPMPECLPMSPVGLKTGVMAQLSVLGRLQALTSRHELCAHAPDVQCRDCAPPSITYAGNPREVGLDPAPEFFNVDFAEVEQRVYAALGQDTDFFAGTPFKEPAMTAKLEKLAFNLIPFAALEDVVPAFAVGVIKHGLDSWRKGMPYSVCASALLRHFSKWQSGEDFDPVDGQPHMAAIAFYTLVILQYERDGRTDLDDRYSRRNNG